jgi:hypothetical protein
MYCTYSNFSIKFRFECTKYIYSNKNPNLISFSTLIMGTKVPQKFLISKSLMFLLELCILDNSNHTFLQLCDYHYFSSHIHPSFHSHCLCLIETVSFSAYADLRKFIPSSVPDHMSICE